MRHAQVPTEVMRVGRSRSGVAFDAMLEAGVRGVMYQEVFGPDPAQCARSMEELEGKVAALRPRQTPLVRLGVSPASAGLRTLFRRLKVSVLQVRAAWAGVCSL